MKKTLTKKIKPEINLTQPGKKVEIKDVYFVLASVFIISAFYFYWFTNYIFFYQEIQSLFIFTREYLQQYSIRPGGLLEYAGNFLTQGYYNYVYGALILSALFTLIALVYIKINKRLSPDGSYSLSLVIIPSCLLILIQSNINWLIHHNIGFLLTGLYFWLSVISDKKRIRVISIVFFPVFFYIAGGYAWIFLLMYILYSFLYEKWIFPSIMLIVAAVSLIVFKEIMFLQPLDLLISYHLPSKDYFINPLFFYFLISIIIIYPVLIKISCSVKLKKDFSRIISQFATPFILVLTIFVLSRLYNPITVNLFKLEKYLVEEDWDNLIKHQESFRSNNIIAQYYYNLALSEKGQLCDRMFFGPQNYGPASILVPWDSKETINYIFRGAYFFYTLGLINEAHRWAFESMVVQGYLPKNIKLLIKTDMINGNYKVAEKYINVLKKTLHYRQWVKKYELMLKNPELIKSDPDLGEKLKLEPKGDFPIRIKNPQTNVLLLLQANPENKKAFEYKMAWYLLEKNVGGIINEIKTMKDIGYTRIPRHIEEAVMAYGMNVGPVPDLGGLKVSSETQKRFNQYETALTIFNGNKVVGGKGVQLEGRNTYWFYLDFK